MHRLQDLVRLCRMNLPCRAVARQLKMGRNTVARCVQAMREAGLLEGDPRDLPSMEELVQAVEKHAPVCGLTPKTGPVPTRVWVE